MEENPNKITYRSFRYVLGAVLTYSIGSFYFGYCLSYFNSIEFKHIYEIFHINMSIKQAQGLFSGCISFGAIFGAYFSSYIINKYSRRQSIIIVDILAIISYVLISVQSALSLFSGRFLQGFCVGVYSSLVPLMIRQISPLQLSGSFGAIMSPAIGCGFFSSYVLSYILNKYLPTAYYWYIVFLFPITIIILQLFLLFKVYTIQTPKYLISQGKIQQAKQLITKIYKDQYIEKILNEKIIDFQKNTKNIAVIVQVQQMEQIQSNLTQKQKQKQNVLDQKQKQNVFSSEVNLQENVQSYPKDIKIAKIYAFILQIFHQFSGISIATIYGAHLAKQAIHSLQAQIPLIINGGKIIAGLCSTLLLKRYGRRFLMLRGLIIILIVLICLSIGFSIKTPQSKPIQIFITTCLVTFVSAFVITQGPITWLYIPQIIQPPTIPYTSMVNWICGCIVITTFPILQDKIQKLFIFFAICTFIHVILCYYCMVETKDKKQIQVRKQFMNVQTRMKNLWNRIKIQMDRNQDN